MRRGDAELRRQVLDQLRALRRRVDPSLLARVLDGVPGWERYDRESAQSAVALFVKGHQDRQRLLAELQRRMAEPEERE